MRPQAPSLASLRLCSFFFWVFLNVNVLALKNASASSSSHSTAPSPSTCPSGTVNYITHALPQQCLTTSWGGQLPPVASSPEPPIIVSSSLSTNRSHTNFASETTESEPLPSATSDLRVSSENASESITTTSNTILATPSLPLNEARGTESKQPENEIDTDSLLDNAQFLSFEDWKQQALAKAEQSAEKMESVRAGATEPRKRPGINNALDSLGEDTEIELDFLGFVPENAEPTAWGRQVMDGATGFDVKDDTRSGDVKDPRSQRRSKDAGKTCKERFNYASFDCAANVLKYNPECSGSSSVLVENKDSYMLNECSSKNKFFIVELCNDILVDTIVLANFEFFSSIFRTFRVSVSDTYPVKLDKWHVLGTFEARNSREVQAFLIENPLIWARYLRIEFLTHYGNEYYCPVSLLRVHGTTPYEELKHEGENSRAEEDVLDQDTAESVATGEQLDPDAVAELLVEEAKIALEKRANVSDSEQTSSPSASVETLSTTASTASASEPTAVDSSVCVWDQALDELLLFSSTLNAELEMCNPTERPTTNGSTAQPVPIPMTSRATLLNGSSQIPSVSPAQHSSSSEHVLVSSSSSNVSTMSPTSVSSKTAISPSALSSSSPRSASQTAGESTKTVSSTTQPPPANPTTQESFLKSIHKRLQMLETNSTLSLLYIEEQSRILRDAFSKVEKRQLSKTTTFLENLNVTVLSELRDFRQQYDQIWQSTVIELENQRESYRREVLAITARLGVLADEVVFQKRMSIVQSILILICLALALFTKGSAANYLELPMMQRMLTRSQSSFFRSSSPTLEVETPSASPSSSRPNSSYMEKRPLRFFRRHKHGLSDESRDDALSPIIQYSPPTPTSDTGPSDHLIVEDEDEQHSRDSSPSSAADPTIRPMSSPPVLEVANSNEEATAWPEGDAFVSQILPPSEALGTPPRHPSFDQVEALENGVKALHTPPNT
jgi:Sad1 / UNC-like C-terminal